MRKSILSLIIIIFLGGYLLTLTPGCSSMTEQDKKTAINAGMDIGVTLLTAYLDYKGMGGNSAAFDSAFENATRKYIGVDDDPEAGIGALYTATSTIRSPAANTELLLEVNRVLEILENLKL